MSTRRSKLTVPILLSAVLVLSTVSCQTAPSPNAHGQPENATEDRAHPTSPLPTQRRVGDLEVVTTFHEHAPSGVAVSEEGRIFVSVPRYDPGVPFTVGELVDDELRPYPNPDINEEDTEKPSSHFLSVDGITIGPSGDLWVLDTARPDFEPTLRRGAKLVQIDLERDEIRRTYVLPRSVASDSSFLADVRIDLRRGKQGHAFITDASPSGLNGLIVIDLASGDAWRKLDLHPATRADPEFIGFIEGSPFLFDPKGRPASPISLGADGLAIDAEGERLYFRPLAGRELYSVRVDALVDRTMPPPRVDSTLRRYGDLGFASDGLAADDKGRIYLTNYEDNAVIRRGSRGGLKPIVLDPRLLWPDSLSVTEGSLYITVNQTHRKGVFNDGRDWHETPYALFRTSIDAGPVKLQ